MKCLSNLLDRHTCPQDGVQHTLHHRPVAVFLTIDDTLAGTPTVGSAALSASCCWSRRTRANVLCKFVLKLAVYRNDGSRIDFMRPHTVSSASIENSPTGFRRRRPTTSEVPAAMGALADCMSKMRSRMCATAHIGDSEHASLCPAFRIRAFQAVGRLCDIGEAQRNLVAAAIGSADGCGLDSSVAAPCKLSDGYPQTGR